ncbi:MAG: hypothetical protein HUJ91_04395 [Bacteroidales bacterium]|nr:hypothetical protein [Bacteroidales bacterium]
MLDHLGFIFYILFLGAIIFLGIRRNKKAKAQAATAPEPRPARTIVSPGRYPTPRPIVYQTIEDDDEDEDVDIDDDIDDVEEDDDEVCAESEEGTRATADFLDNPTAADDGSSEIDPVMLVIYSEIMKSRREEW